MRVNQFIKLTTILFTALLLMASVAAWGSFSPGHLSVKPSVTINQAVSQTDPTNMSPILYSVVFSKIVTHFTTGDVTITGTAPGIKTGVVTGSGRYYTVAVSGMTGNGTVIADIAAGCANDAVGNLNTASTSTDNTVTYDIIPPSVTINRSVSQSDPTNRSPINFTVVFSEAVTNFTTGDVTLSSTAPGLLMATVTGSGTTYNVSVSGMLGSGTVIARIGSGRANDAAGNRNLASTSTDNSVVYDVTHPAVTINQASRQADPTNRSPINFSVVFSENVVNFTDSDIALSGTAPGVKLATVTGSGRTYNVAVTGMTGNGTVSARILAGGVTDAAGNTNVASTSTDNQVMYDITAPSVTINQAAGQADPTNLSPINFTVIFSENVTNFRTGDVTISSTAPGVMLATVTGSGRIYNVAVTGMTGNGTVIARVFAGRATDAAGNANTASTSTDNTVVYDVTHPAVTINQAVGQVDPTNLKPINFTVVFSENVANFRTGDVTISSTAPGVMLATVTGSGRIYNVAVTGMTGSGTLIARVFAGRATDAAGNANTASTSTDNQVIYDITAPTVTINQAVGQADPTNHSPINFTVVFSENVANFSTGDVVISGTTPGVKLATVTGSGRIYNVAVTGMTGNGTVIARVFAGRATDAAGNANTASTSTDNTVIYDITAPTVTINQAVGQADPTNLSPINFTVVFSENVANFTTGDVAISGTAPGVILATVTGSGSTYNVAVSGMTGNGTVTAQILAGRATDVAGNANTASTSTDNTVIYDITAPSVTINQAIGQADPTNLSPINFTVVFSENVANFNTGDVTISNTATGVILATVTGSGSTYNVAVSGMTGDGTVTAQVLAGRATDAAGNANTASTSLDNEVTFDFVAPTVTATIPENGENGVPVNRSLSTTFSEEMQPLTNLTFTLKQGLTSIAGTVSNSGLTATFNPIAALAFNTVYTATITTGAKDLIGNPLASNYSWSFTTGIAPDTSAPTVTSTIPENNETGVPINSSLSATFSEGMRPITNLTFTLKQGLTSIAGTVSNSGVTATFNPTAALAFNTVYTATITTGAKDLAGNPLASDYSWQFTTGIAPDTSAPTVTSTIPDNGDTGVAVNSSLAATFSEGMRPLTNITFTLKRGLTSVAGTVSNSGVTATFNPTAALAFNTVYTATITTGAKDLAGNPLASDYTWSFTTGIAPDTIAPTVISTIPVNGKTGVPVNSSLSAVFSEGMRPLTNITFTLKQGLTPIAGTVSNSGVTAIFNPTAALAFNKVYTATITTGAKDLAGNPLASDYTWSFTTGIAPDTSAPTVISTIPIDGEKGVPVNSSLTATFSEGMRPLTNLTFTLKQGLTPIAGTVSNSGVTATFKPSVSLEFKTVYTATITTGAKDLAGNPLASDYSWSFTTEKPPIDLGAAAPFGGFGGNAGMTNQGVLTIINGDIGTTAVSTTMTGFHDSTGDGYTETPLNIGDVKGRIYTDAPPPVIFASGGPFGGNAVTKEIADAAAADALAAYDYLAGLPGGAYAGAGELGGLTLSAGTYTSATSFKITNGDLTLTGNANDIWVFQMGTSLTVGAPGFPRNVTLAGGAQAKNVFWQVGSAARIEDNCNMVGTIIAKAGVTISTAGQLGITTLEGRALGLNASVTVVNTHINVP